jgi:hypothetical protein
VRCAEVEGSLHEVAVGASAVEGGGGGLGGGAHEEVEEGADHQHSHLLRQQAAAVHKQIKYLVANATLFDLFLFHTWVQVGVHRIGHTLDCLGFALWMVLKMTGSLFVEEMSCCDSCGLKSVEELCHSLTGLEPMPHTSVALMAQYLNVRQRKLGTIII